MNDLLKKELPEYALDFLEDLKGKGRKESTVIRYNRDLLFFFRWVKKIKGNTEMETWKSLDIGDYRRFYSELKDNYTNSTIKRIRTVITSLQRFYELDVYEEDVLPFPIKERPLTKNDFVTEAEFEQMIKTMKSEKGLTDHQLIAFPFLSRRNQSIAILFYHYGLSMTEITRINTEDINFAQHELTVKNGNGDKRIIFLEHEHQQILLQYYNEDIPKPVRPHERTTHPFFVSFDFKRETFRWNYEAGSTKRLTVKAIQKMMKQEVTRSGLRKGISSQTMRNSCIIRMLNEGKMIEEIQHYFGMKTPLSLWRYEKYVRENKEIEK